MLRLRWTDHEQEDALGSAGWRGNSAVIAALFLNFTFWLYPGGYLWMFYPLPVYAALTGLLAVLFSVLFFMGPAFASRAAGRGPIETAASSIGRIPAAGLLLCSIVHLVAWLTGQISISGNWLLSRALPRSEGSKLFYLGVIVALLSYIFFTATRGAASSAKLANITNRFALAILAAGIIRVHHGWPTIPAPIQAETAEAVANTWGACSRIALYAGPMCFLAAHLVRPPQTASAIRRIGLMGVMLPLGGGLLLVGALNAATLHSDFYQPSLAPDIAMALWGHAAGSAIPPRLMLIAITTFGALRFGARTLSSIVLEQFRGFLPAHRTTPAVFLATALFYLVLSWDAVRELLIWTGTLLVVAAGILAADAYCGRMSPSKPPQRFDPVGCAAFATGLCTALALFANAGWETWNAPWALPASAAAFLVCAGGRTLARRPSRMPS